MSLHVWKSEVTRAVDHHGRHPASVWCEADPGDRRLDGKGNQGIQEEHQRGDARSHGRDEAAARVGYSGAVDIRGTRAYASRRRGKAGAQAIDVESGKDN